MRALAFVFLLPFVGCKPQQAKSVVENSAALAQYSMLLDECRAKGRAVGSYAVYEACADDVDAHLCREHGLRCPEDQ